MNKDVSVLRAIVTGQLIVNLPITIIITGAAILFALNGWSLSLGAILGCVIGWLYWSYSIPKWRNWALAHGVNKEELSKWGRRTLLTWKEDSLLAKTEFRENKEK